MPIHVHMPRLLKRLSEKSLRRRSKSTDSDAGPLESPPPLPITQSWTNSSSNTSLGLPQRPTLVTANGSAMSVAASAAYDKPTPPTPKIPNGQIPAVLYPPPPGAPPPTNGVSIPQDELSISLQAAWKSATTDPKMSKGDKILQTVENGAVAVMGKEAQGASLVAGIKIGLDAVGGLEGIEKGINAFMEGMPVLMNALDEVAKLHPFIGVAVMAFKAVWALEQKRRDNDRKIMALHMEMKDMMGVLTQLKSVKDADEIAPDGSTIKGRMQIIVENTAKDIKACANACDTYVKKKLIVKVLKGPIWEGKLAAFAGSFTKRRSEFEFAMSIHTSLGVDAAVLAIGLVDETTKAMSEKMDMMMKLFSQMVSPEQKEMTRLVEQKGGAACLDNDKALKELNEYENKVAGSQGANVVHGGKAAKSDLSDLKDELHIDVDSAINENFTTFARKFEVQQRQIIDELSRVVQREGDRVISAVLSGPHDKIIDPNVHAVWKEMGWRGSVKARHFVMALRDHFQEDRKPRSPNADADEEPVPIANKEDSWALEYIRWSSRDLVIALYGTYEIMCHQKITCKRLLFLIRRSITEAFDDDASGFITVAEANTFTTSRPLDWSLERWIAYWSIGAHQTYQLYANKINELLGKMFALKAHVLPANKSDVDRYLMNTYHGVYTLVGSLNVCYIDSALQERFQSYVDAEEERIRGNLEAVRYDIDALDTLELVTGDGRIDRYILTVIYLLLERHFQMLRACQEHVLHPSELWDSADTLVWVFDSANIRLDMLQSIFKQQKLDLKQQFKSFCFGLYEYSNEPNLLWDAKIVQQSEFVEYAHDERAEQPLDLVKILNYPYDQETLDFAAFAPESTAEKAGEVLPAAAGLLSAPWHGFFYWPNTLRYPSAGMLSLDLKPSSVDGAVQYFQATSRANSTDFSISGECRDKDGVMTVTFKRTFPAQFPTQFWHGVWDSASDTLTGTLGPEEDPRTHGASFSFKHISPELVCFAPSPVDLAENKPRALWGFAISAVLNGVQRKRYSWTYFKERGDNRRRFIELYIRGGGNQTFGVPLSYEEQEELYRVKKSFTTAESRFYHSIAESKIRAMSDHNCTCDACEGPIGGARISCLTCQTQGTFNTVDFDESPSCILERIVRDDLPRPHLPHHDLMKVRRVVHTRQFGPTYRAATEALQYARTFFKPSASAPAEQDSESDTEDEEGHPPEVMKRMSMVSKRISTTLAVSIPDAPSRGPKSAITISEPPAGPRCLQCDKTVTQPCWYCVQCADTSFICWDCDLKGEVKFGEHDWHNHDLVRVQQLVEDKDLTMEERFAELDERFSKHQKTMDERLGQLEAKVDSRMAKVEQLLEQVLMKLGT